MTSLAAMLSVKARITACSCGEPRFTARGVTRILGMCSPTGPHRRVFATVSIQPLSASGTRRTRPARARQPGWTGAGSPGAFVLYGGLCAMTIPMTVAVMMKAVPAHAMWQFVTGQDTVAVRVHTPEHGDKPGAELIR